jgi:hypothetical protein
MIECLNMKEAPVAELLFFKKDIEPIVLLNNQKVPLIREEVLQ